MADVDVSKDFERQARQLETLDRLAQRFGSSLQSALSSSSTSGRELSGILDRVGASLQSSLGSSLSSSLASLVQGAAQSLFSTLGMMSFGGLFPFAKGGVVAGGKVQPFAEGGIVSAPTYFPLRGGLGLMGERGAEAIMPLARGPDGRLGVSGGGGTTHVNVTIQAADLASFKHSEAQVSAALARAVARGRRAL